MPGVAGLSATTKTVSFLETHLRRARKFYLFVVSNARKESLVFRVGVACPNAVIQLKRGDLFLYSAFFRWPVVVESSSATCVIPVSGARCSRRPESPISFWRFFSFSGDCVNYWAFGGRHNAGTLFDTNHKRIERSHEGIAPPG